MIKTVAILYFIKAAQSSNSYCSFYYALNIPCPKNEVTLRSKYFLKIVQDGGENISATKIEKLHHIPILAIQETFIMAFTTHFGHVRVSLSQHLISNVAEF